MVIVNNNGRRSAYTFSLGFFSLTETFSLGYEEEIIYIEIDILRLRLIKKKEVVINLI